MESVWLKPQLSDAIINNEAIFDQIQNIVSDILLDRVSILMLLENMRGVLTNTIAEYREKGMHFFTKILKDIPSDYLDTNQVKLISVFYTDRLKDVHRVLPPLLEGYLVIMDMKNYKMEYCGDFFQLLFKEVGCQMQVRQERYHIYLIIQKFVDRDPKYMKSLGINFPYGVIQAMDGERDPRNLLFLFSFLPRFFQQIPLEHLVDEAFSIISCYYPIDFHPKPNDPFAVTRQELADTLAPCLCAIPEFSEQCLVLLIDKLDSSLSTAKLDSLKLLAQSCKIFTPQSYTPFLKSLWGSIHREINHKTDSHLQLAAHEALSTLVRVLASTADTDQVFENFLKGILITLQQSIAEATTVYQYVQAVRVLSTVANSSKESCIIIARTMIPSTVAFYEFKQVPKLQIASLEYLGELYELAKYWEVLDAVEKQVNEIPRQCLVAVSQPTKEYQIAGFTTLIKVKNALQSDLVLPFVEILTHLVQHSEDKGVLSIVIDAIHALAKIYPEQIMELVVRGKCDLENLTSDDTAIEKRLDLLSSLASIDDFTKMIIQEMLKVVESNDKDAAKVVHALSVSISNSSLYTPKKVAQIESDHGLVESIMKWVYKEIKSNAQDSLTHAYALISSTVSNLPAEQQQELLTKHTQKLLDLCRTEEIHFFILESMYNGLQQSLYNYKFQNILNLSLKLSLCCEIDAIRDRAYVLVAHLLNKAEYGPNFEMLYQDLKQYLQSINKEDMTVCPRLIMLYGWITKALVMRGSDLYTFWLQKITKALMDPDYCGKASEAVQLIMRDSEDNLSSRLNCRVTLLYKQRMFQKFAETVEKIENVSSETKESYLLSWGYVLEKIPKTVLNNEVDKIAPLVIESLECSNHELQVVMLDILCHFAQSCHTVVSDSLQTILPRLLKLSSYVKSMDVRIKSLECLYEIAQAYNTVLLLPYKQDLLLDLAPALDDHKRLVRNAAVRARTRWYLVGAPGEDKQE